MKAITLLSTALFLLVPASALADESPSEQPPPSDEPPAQADTVRVRGGIGAVSGFLYVTAGSRSAVAPALGFSGRIGVQMNRYFSLYYQNMGAVPIADGAAFLDYNSFLANLTAANMLDVGAGPSLDVVTVSSGSSSGAAVLFGVHGRLAVNFSGARGNEPRRSGLSVGIDLHPTFGPGGVLFAFTGGVGYEWF